MSTADLLSLCAYGLASLALGKLFLRAVAAPALLLRSLGRAYLVGQLLWLLCFQAAVWLPVPGDILVWAVGTAALAWGCVRAWRDRSRFVRALPALLFGVLIVGVCFPHGLYSILRLPLVDWDARSIWFFHGKAIWLHRGITPDFFANAPYAWSHLDYPLLIPVQAAVVGVFRGAWSEMAVKGFLGLNFMAYLGVLHATLVGRGWSRLHAWAASVMVMGIALPSYLNGYADNHYAMPLMLAALLAFQPHRDGGDLAMVGVLVCFALNVKNEAAPYVLLGAVLWCVWWYASRVGNQNEVAGERRRGVSGYGVSILLLGTVPFLLWMLFKSVHGIEGDLQLGARVLTPGDSLALWMQRAPRVLNAIGWGHAAMHTPLMLVGLLALSAWGLLLARRSGKGGQSCFTYEERALWSLLMVVHLLVMTVYGLTPYDVRWHLGNSLNRLLVFPVLILAALLLCAFEKVLGDNQGNRASSGAPPGR